MIGTMPNQHMLYILSTKTNRKLTYSNDFDYTGSHTNILCYFFIFFFVCLFLCVLSIEVFVQAHT